jgi:hypothetical protein
MAAAPTQAATSAVGAAAALKTVRRPPPTTRQRSPARPRSATYRAAIKCWYLSERAR